ncbi:hypothetical protein [Phenylobacterium sp.]|jgi:hypothetical protein|uniref:hypothetical protein n=1 Tax=Phenylobacterium sp. TaxID=1871053 RepID=UPI002F3FB1ED
MSQAETGRETALARNLLEILGPYEEELMAFERLNPAAGALRRAVGIAIAEACYLISDPGVAQAEWAPPTDDSARRTR